MNKAQAGRFIVIEGLEGAGKSTAVKTIKQCLSKNHKELLITREPGGTKTGEIIRELIKGSSSDETLDVRAELLLLYAARVQLVEQIIKPTLARGVWVVSDRFELSTYAYQGGGRRVDKSVIDRLSSLCLNNFTPDLTLFLDVRPEQGLQRAKKRGKIDRIEQETTDFFEDVYTSYHAHLKTMTSRVIIIDASQTINLVQREIKMAMQHYLTEQVLPCVD